MRTCSWSSWAVFLAVELLWLGCSTATSTGHRDDRGGGGPGSGAEVGAASGGGAPGSPCGVDCSQIEAPACLAAVCDEASGRCKLVPSAGGEVCDDRNSCTIGETCRDGLCRGGAPNDCGLVPDSCHTVACAEVDGAPRCALQVKSDGSPCATEDRCRINPTCQSGVCVGAKRDCFFFPLPDSCHVGECNPSTGLCEAVPGNEGSQCEDSGDLCKIGKTCRNGLCEGGAPKDCSALSVGCSVGVCDPGSGDCHVEPVAPGGDCASGTDECNRGICDDGGACISIPTPGAACASQTQGCTTGVCSDAGVCTPRSVPDGGACVDADWCTVGEVCRAGVCQGGHPAARPAVYFRETFEDDAAGWELGPTWQIGAARASRGHTYGNPDPPLDHTATADNGVAGVVLGGNVPLGVHPAYHLTSPAVDASAEGGVYLTFWRVLNSDEAPQMTNRVEVWNGFRWVVLFESGTYPGVRDATWTKVTYDLTPHKNAGLRVRFGYAIGRDSFVDTVSGWNVDDVEIVSAVCP